ncbi:MAG TPA: response regulator [Solirubrobacter sp.]
MSAQLAHPTTDDRRAVRDDHSPMRVLLADREGAARYALAALLQSLPGIMLVGMATSMVDVAESLRRHRPEVLIVDDRLLRDGAHVLAGTGPTPAPVRVIVVGVDDDPAFARRAKRLGAEAWVAKDRADDELPKLLETP